jgi:hypothetical protein
LREERSLSAYKNRVLRRIFGPRRDEATREWRKINKKELHDPNCSPTVVRVIKSRMRWGSM